MNQVILHHEGRRNPGDGVVRDGDREKNGTKQENDVKQETKQGQSAWRSTRWPFERFEQGNQSPPMWPGPACV
jgi:hypothetical protein